jgi:hypothetical protein
MTAFKSWPVVLIAFALWASPPQALAQQEGAQQESIQLTLRAAPDGVFSRGTPLPPGTRVAVLDSATANRGAVRLRDFQADALARAPTARYDSLHGDGGTYEVYPSTSGSDRAYYVVARTKEGELYHSVVQTADAGVLPGYDAVYSGNMTLAPLAAAEQARQLLAALPGLTPAPATPAVPATTPVEIESADPPIAASALGGGDSNSKWLWLLGGTALGVMLGGLGAALLARRRHKGFNRQTDAHERAAQNVSRASRGGHGAARFEQLYREACAERDKWRAEFERARQDAAELQKTVRQLRAAGNPDLSSRTQTAPARPSNSAPDWEAIQPHRHSASEMPARPVAGLAPVASTPSSHIGDAFVAHCNEGKLVDRVARFQKKLDEQLPGASVSEVLRDLRAPGVVFKTSSQQQGLKYWLVETAGQSYLLPHPKSTTGFTELLADCFGGSAPAPNELRHCEAAQVTSRGDGEFTISKPGRLG